MGNISSRGGGGGGSGRRRHGTRRSDTSPAPPPPPPSHPPAVEIPPNRYVFAAATPYPNPNPNPNSHQYYQFPGYYPPPPASMPAPLPAPYNHHHQHHHLHPQQYHQWAAGGRFPYGPMMPPPLPYVEHQKAVTIRNDVNLKKETLRLEPDPDNAGRFLVSFTFDATVSGRITVIFFAKEGEECNLTTTKGDILLPISVNFERGLGQKFSQPTGTGIDFSVFEDLELLEAANADIHPLAIKAEAMPVADDSQNGSGGGSGSMNAQITQAVFEKEKGEIKVRVVKQILWVNGMRYELQEIYGIGNSVDDEEGAADEGDPGKECVICLSEPRDTTVLPCRHMCMCSGCAKVLRFQTNRCPICRQPVERLLEIKVNKSNSNVDNNNGGDE